MQTSTPSHRHDYHWYNVWKKRSNSVAIDTSNAHGHQIFHLDIDDRPLWNDSESMEYAKKHMSKAKKFSSDAQILKFAVEEGQKTKGLFLEFGVWSGMTTNFIAGLSPYHTLHAFDSFQGLPKDWSSIYPKGTFGLNKNAELPALLPNIQLHIGWFDNTLPLFKEETLKNNSIAFIHVDCSMYCSTKTIFAHLKNSIQSGTVIQFDEYFNIENWKDNEYRAFQEFILRNNSEYEYLAYNDCHSQVTVRVK